MVREVSVCKEAEAEVEADEADAADEAVEVILRGTFDRESFGIEYAGNNKADDHNDNQSRSGPAPDLFVMRYFRFVLPLFGTPFPGSFLFSLFIKGSLCALRLSIVFYNIKYIIKIW